MSGQNGRACDARRVGSSLLSRFTPRAGLRVARRTAAGAMTPLRLAGVRGLAVAMLLAGLSPVLGAAPAHALVPSNDSFAGAQVVSGPLPVSLAGTNVEATKEPGEPNHAGNAGGKSVWYRWTPAATVVAVVETCVGSSFDTTLAIYTGNAVNALALVVSNDDACDARSRVSFTAVAAQTYYVAVDGFNGLSGTFQLAIGANAAGPNPPPNDNFAAAQVLSGSLPVDVTGSTVDASSEPFEPNHAGKVGGRSVWYAWSAASAGLVEVETCGSGIDTLLAVYTGATASSLTPVASNDNSTRCANSNHSLVSFVASEATTYRIAIDGLSGAAGTVRLTVRAANAPANDNFAGAQIISGPPPATLQGTNVHATREPGEPNHADEVGGKSVWYRWTPSETVVAAVETCVGSSFDTLLAVYTGSAAERAGTGREQRRRVCHTQQGELHRARGCHVQHRSGRLRRRIGNLPARSGRKPTTSRLPLTTASRRPRSLRARSLSSGPRSTSVPRRNPPSRTTAGTMAARRYGSRGHRRPQGCMSRRRVGARSTPSSASTPAPP